MDTLRVVGATALRNTMRDVLDYIRIQRKPVIVTHGNRPVAKMMPLSEDDYAAFNLQVQATQSE